MLTTEGIFPKAAFYVGQKSKSKFCNFGSEIFSFELMPHFEKSYSMCVESQSSRKSKVLPLLRGGRGDESFNPNR